MNHIHLLFHYFCDFSLGNIPKILLKFFSKKSLIFFFNHTIFLRFVLNFLQNLLFSKKLKSIYKSFYNLKSNIIVFNECFCYFLFIGLISNQFTYSHDILKIQLYNQILQFQHQIKL
jgi:hypothetical protein